MTWETLIASIIVFVLILAADLIFIEPSLKALHERLDNDKK